MALTYTMEIGSATVATEDHTLYGFDLSEWRLVDTQITQNGSKSRYVCSVSNAESPMTLEARRTYRASTDTTAFTLQLTAPQKVADSVSGIDTYQEVTFSQSVIIPGKIVRATSSVLQLLEALLVLFIGDSGVTPSIPSTDVLDSFSLGITDILS